MKHNWKLLTPGSGPLVATTDINAAFRYTVGWRLVCKKCKECLTVPYDELDTDRIVKFVAKQNKRSDCK